MPWSEDKKVQIERAIGSLEYTSSDESDFSGSENGVQKLSGYLVKKKHPGRDQHLLELKEASMMLLLKGSLLGQGQTFCQGEGIRDLLLWV